MISLNVGDATLRKPWELTLTGDALLDIWKYTLLGAAEFALVTISYSSNSKYCTIQSCTGTHQKLGTLRARNTVLYAATSPYLAYRKDARQFLDSENLHVAAE